MIVAAMVSALQPIAAIAVLQPLEKGRPAAMKKSRMEVDFNDLDQDNAAVQLLDYDPSSDHITVMGEPFGLLSDKKIKRWLKAQHWHDLPKSIKDAVMHIEISYEVCPTCGGPFKMRWTVEENNTCISSGYCEHCHAALLKIECLDDNDLVYNTEVYDSHDGSFGYKYLVNDLDEV